MMNPTDKQLSVQMAFPFVARVGELSSDDVVITVDGTPVPYDTYIGIQLIAMELLKGQ